MIDLQRKTKGNLLVFHASNFLLTLLFFSVGYKTRVDSGSMFAANQKIIEEERLRKETEYHNNEDIVEVSKQCEREKVRLKFCSKTVLLFLKSRCSVSTNFHFLTFKINFHLPKKKNFQGKVSHSVLCINVMKSYQKGYFAANLLHIYALHGLRGSPRK